MIRTMIALHGEHANDKNSGIGFEGATEFDGAIALSLPVGSELVLNSNGANVAKYCVAAMPLEFILCLVYSLRIEIIFR